MMSAAQSPTTLESKLEALQCHFTWKGLDLNRSRLFRLRYNMEDIGTEEGNSWLGHIYNLQGFIQYKLGPTEDAQSLFNKAAEAFTQTRGAAEGPWLVVNYGNLAWLHHHLGDQAESQAYLSKVDALMEKYPSPSQDELHPEIYAEKAWTLMKFSGDKEKDAADYFQRAIRMQPDMVEWNTSRILALVNAAHHNKQKLGADVFEEMRIAKEQDPENLYLAALYLEQRAKNRETIEDEACELSRKVLRNPVSSYSGMTPLLRLYRVHISMPESIKLAEEALKEHPGARYVKWCAALCYKSKVLEDNADSIEVERAISLCKEVIDLYADSSFIIKIALAEIYAKWNRRDEALEIYKELQRKDLNDKETERLSRESRNFFNCKQDHRRPIDHQTEVKTETPQPSVPCPSIGSFVGGAAESWRKLNSGK